MGLIAENENTDIAYLRWSGRFHEWAVEERHVRNAQQKYDRKIVEEYIAHLKAAGYAPSTVNQAAAAIRKEAYKEGYDIRITNRPEVVQKLPVILGKEEIAKLITYIPRFCSELNLSSDVSAKAIEIIKRVEDIELTSGQEPIGIAAAVIYIAASLAGEHRTQKMVSDVTGVTEVTLRARYKELSKQDFIPLLEIDRMVSELELQPNVKDTALQLYKKIAEKGFGGRSISSIISTAVYITARQYRTPRTLEEVRDISRVSMKEISITYRHLLRELGLMVPENSPVDFVPRFCSKLNLSSDVSAKAIKIIERASEKELTAGRGPIGIAAAAIYLAAILAKEYRGQEKVSDVTGVTEVTIRNRFRELVEELDIDEKRVWDLLPR